MWTISIVWESYGGFLIIPISHISACDGSFKKLFMFVLLLVDTDGKICLFMPGQDSRGCKKFVWTNSKKLNIKNRKFDFGDPAPIS